MALTDRILRSIGTSGPMDDDELAQRIGVVRQQVNQAARRLEKAGRLRRYVGPRGKIVNALTGDNQSQAVGARS